MKKLVVVSVALLSLLIAPAALAQTYSGGCVAVSSGLAVGSRGVQVSQLQTFLVAQNYPGSGSWMITGYFGQATAAALRDFQSQHGLPQSGMVDAATASAIQTASCGYSYGYPSTYAPIATNYPSNYSYPSYLTNYYGGAPVITTLSQNTGTSGQQMTIYGAGFDAYNNTVNFGGTAVSGLSSNGSSITFTIPSTQYYSYSLSGTQIQLSVSDSRGTSNALSFTVWGSPSACGGYSYNYGQCGCAYQNYSYAYNANCNTQPVNTANPTISYISPNSGAVGTIVTVYGSGFTSSNNSVHFGSGVITGLLSQNGTSLSFAVPSALSGYGSQPITLSTYQVSVQNAYGITSNSAPFTITSLAQGGQPIISNESGPNTLNAGQQGVWSFVVNAPTSQYLTVSVSWGDQNYANAQPAAAQQSYLANQTVQLTHTYYQSGTYQIVFTVSNGSQSNTYATNVVVSGSSNANGAPSLSFISPNSAYVGQQVTVYGSNLSGANTVNFGSGAIQNVYSNNGTSLTFTVPQSVGPYCAPGTACPQYAVLINPGTYNISVMNQWGTSNSLTFTVQ